jgi:hypothetical protein
MVSVNHFQIPGIFQANYHKVINASAVTHQLANIYQPNMVLNQCVSILIIQSHADTEELTAKNNQEPAESFLPSASTL